MPQLGSRPGPRSREVFGLLGQRRVLVRTHAEWSYRKPIAYLATALAASQMSPGEIEQQLDAFCEREWCKLVISPDSLTAPRTYSSHQERAGLAARQAQSPAAAACSHRRSALRHRQAAEVAVAAEAGRGLQALTRTSSDAAPSPKRRQYAHASRMSISAFPPSFVGPS